MPETQQQSRKTQARRAMYRRLAIEAAERVFAAKGYAGTRMQDVAAEAGMALGTLYGICAGKDELYGAVHQQRGEQMLVRAAEKAAEASSPLEALRLGIRVYVAFLAEHPRLPSASPPGGSAVGAFTALHLRDAAHAMASGPRPHGRGLSGRHRRRTFIGEEPAHMARVMIAAHQVFLVEWLEDEQRQSVDALVTRMVAFVERSFWPPELDLGGRYLLRLSPPVLPSGVMRIP